MTELHELLVDLMVHIGVSEQEVQRMVQVLSEAGYEYGIFALGNSKLVLKESTIRFYQNRELLETALELKEGLRLYGGELKRFTSLLPHRPYIELDDHL